MRVTGAAAPPTHVAHAAAAHLGDAQLKDEHDVADAAARALRHVSTALQPKLHGGCRGGERNVFTTTSSVLRLRLHAPPPGPLAPILGSVVERSCLCELSILPLRAAACNGRRTGRLCCAHTTCAAPAKGRCSVLTHHAHEACNI